MNKVCVITPKNDESNSQPLQVKGRFNNIEEAITFLKFRFEYR